MGRGAHNDGDLPGRFQFEQLQQSRLAAAAVAVLAELEQLLADAPPTLACWAALAVRDLAGRGEGSDAWRDDLYPLLARAAAGGQWTSADAEAAYAAARVAEGEWLDLHHHQAVATRLLGRPQQLDLDSAAAGWALHAAVLACWAMVLPQRRSAIATRACEATLRAAALALTFGNQPRLRSFIDETRVNMLLAQTFAAQDDTRRASIIDADPELAGYTSWEEWEREVELAIADERVVEVNTLIELLTAHKFSDLQTVLPLAAQGALEVRHLIALPEPWLQTLGPLLERLAAAEPVHFSDDEWNSTLAAVTEADRAADLIRAEFEGRPAGSKIGHDPQQALLAAVAARFEHEHASLSSGRGVMAMDNAIYAAARACKAALYAAASPDSPEALRACRESLQLAGSALVEVRDLRALSRYLQLLAA